MRSRTHTVEEGLTRRQFVRRMGALGTGVAAGSAAPKATLGTGGGDEASRPVVGASPAASPPLWSVELSPDQHHFELAFRGRAWLSSLRVNLKVNGNTYSSDAPAATLELSRWTTKLSRWTVGRTLIRVKSPAAFEILFSPEGSRLEVRLQSISVAGIRSAEIEGVIEAGLDPIQARLTQGNGQVQQMASGLAASRLNDCVFDRFSDEALRVVAFATDFTPQPDGFRLLASANRTVTPLCCFEVIERVYQSRLPYYAPLDKKKWPEPPSGWCSFHYYGNVLTENDVLRNAEALARDYEAFGLQYILIDGGWQAKGISGTWTEANDSFPHGMQWLAEGIHALGLKAALWLSVFGTEDESFYKAHRDWFLHDATGNAKLGTWYGTYIADFSDPGMRQYLYGVYRQISADWGYDYFKLDGENATRDIWGANRVRAYDPALDADTGFRQALSMVRKGMECKPEVFFSACGPEYPTESMGIAQSARLGGDIIASNQGETPSFRGVRTALEGMRRGYYTHNIAWYGDPDGVLLRPPLTLDEVQTWFSVVGLTGQLLMLGDNMPELPAERRDIPRKIMPVADIKPMDLYPQSKTPNVWVLHVARPFGRWAVAGLFNWDYNAQEVPFTAGDGSDFFDVLNQNEKILGRHYPSGHFWALANDTKKALAENRRLEALSGKPPGLELLPVPAYVIPPLPRRITLNFSASGLDGSPDYLLFDFWKQEFLGKVQREYSVSLPPHACQVVSVRATTGHPQLVGTDRHITMGGVEISGERWSATQKQLNFAVKLVRNYASKFVVYRAGSRLAKATASGARLDISESSELITVTLERPTTGAADVWLRFA